MTTTIAAIGVSEAVDLYERICATLADADGGVQITTYLHSTVYQHKHRDMLRLRGGNIEVRHGKRWDAITIGGKASVGIRMGHYQS